MSKNYEQTGRGGCFSWPNVLDAELPEAAPADDDDAFPIDDVIDWKWFQRYICQKHDKWFIAIRSAANKVIANCRFFSMKNRSSGSVMWFWTENMSRSTFILLKWAWNLGEKILFSYEKHYFLQLSTIILILETILTLLILPKKSGLLRFCLECTDWLSYGFWLAPTQHSIKTNSTQIAAINFDWNENMI